MLGSQSAPTLVSGAHGWGTQGLQGTAHLMLGGDVSQPGTGAEMVVGGPASECPCGVGVGGRDRRFLLDSTSTTTEGRKQRTRLHQN